MMTERIPKTQKLLQELGHTDIVAALQEAIEMQQALRVIATWATMRALEPVNVLQLIAKVLKK